MDSTRFILQIESRDKEYQDSNHNKYFCVDSNILILQIESRDKEYQDSNHNKYFCVDSPLSSISYSGNLMK